MTVARSLHTLDLSRRGLLRGAVLVAGSGALLGAGLAAQPAQAKSKISQITASYRSTPRGKQRCDNCTQWEAPASCKTVAGVIAPSGWCTLYAPGHG
jgi:hypothetical protein